MGFITLRHTLLDRGLDMPVRKIRLGTGANRDHDDIEDSVCANAGLIRNCESSLRLEMRKRSIRDYTSLSGEVDCTVRAEESEPLMFQSSGEHDLMTLRACYKYEPFFPDDLLGKLLNKDTSGDASIVAITAFVQKPE